LVHVPEASVFDCRQATISDPPVTVVHEPICVQPAGSDAHVAFARNAPATCRSLALLALSVKLVVPFPLPVLEIAAWELPAKTQAQIKAHKTARKMDVFPALDSRDKLRQLRRFRQWVVRFHISAICHINRSCR
jgi:hypothetical protein